LDAGKPVGAICHGAWMLCSAKCLQGRRLTCFVAIKDDVENAGGLYEDASVIVDGNLVTSRIPSDLPDFCKAFLLKLAWRMQIILYCDETNCLSSLADTGALLGGTSCRAAGYCVLILFHLGIVQCFCLIVLSFHDFWEKNLRFGNVIFHTQLFSVYCYENAYWSKCVIILLRFCEVLNSFNFG